jgi:hypothetical protein
MQSEIKRHDHGRDTTLRPPNAARVHDRARRTRGPVDRGLNNQAVRGRALGRPAPLLPPGAPRIEGASDL